MDPIKLGTLVELLDQYSNVYRRSPTAARGWVKARREWPQRDPEVWIEWDKTHWRYHQEADGWTYEHHFRAVNDTVPDLPPELQAELQSGDADTFARFLRSIQEGMASCRDCGQAHTPGDAQAEYIDGLMAAQEAALGADGYLIITITPRAENGVTVYSPEVFNQHLNEAAQQTLETQVVHLATQLFEEDMMRRVAEIKKDADEPGA